MVSVELLSNMDIILSCVYIPPDCSHTYMDQITQAFQSFSCENKLIVLGDFNTPAVDWSTLSASSTNSQTLMCDIFFHLKLSQMITTPTHSKGHNMDHPIRHIHIDVSSSAITSVHYPITRPSEAGGMQGWLKLPHFLRRR